MRVHSLAAHADFVAQKLSLRSVYIRSNSDAFIDLFRYLTLFQMQVIIALALWGINGFQILPQCRFEHLLKGLMKIQD